MEPASTEIWTIQAQQNIKIALQKSLPVSNKLYHKGTRECSIIPLQLRMGCSELSVHIYNHQVCMRWRLRRYSTLLLSISRICGTTRFVSKYNQHDIQLHVRYYAIWLKIMNPWRKLLYLLICSQVRRYQTIKIGMICICGVYGCVRMDFTQGKLQWMTSESPFLMKRLLIGPQEM